MKFKISDERKLTEPKSFERITLFSDGKLMIKESLHKTIKEITETGNCCEVKNYLVVEGIDFITIYPRENFN